VVDLSPAIVAPAFTDPVLVEGWLHPTARLVPTGTSDPIIRAGAPWIVEPGSPEWGSLRVELRAEGGGTRGAVTRVIIAESGLATEADRLDALALWNTRLDQLEDLLRGHPVSWSSWEADHGDAYARYRAAAAVGSTGA